MISVRLPEDLEKQLESISQQEQATKTEIIKEALNDYITKHTKKQYPYALGADLFGKQGSGKGDLSKTYKQKVREKINEKMSR